MNAGLPVRVAGSALLPNSMMEAGNCRAEPTKRRHGLVACARHPGPEWKGMQDYVECRDLGRCKVLAVADGVSASLHGEVAAEIAVKAFLQEVETAWDQGRRIGRGVMREAYHRACEQIRARVAEEAWGSSPQSTLIGVVETPGRFLISYVGDGAVVLSVGSMNYGMLLPHTGYGGFLTKVVSAGPCPRPAYLEIDKGWSDGEVLLAGTDGVFPPGQTLRVAREIMSALRNHFRAACGRLGAQEVADTLLEYLSGLSFDDNRAVGVILTERALAQWEGSGQ